MAIQIYTVDYQGNRTWLPATYANIADAMAVVRRLETNPAVAAAVPATRNLPAA